MATSKKTATKKINKSAVDGTIVSNSFAKKNPTITYAQTVPVKKAAVKFAKKKS